MHTLTQHPAAGFLKEALTAKRRPAQETPVLDGVKTETDEEVMDSAAQYASADIALKAAAAVQEWAETAADDLGAGEGYADRLLSLIVGIADADIDGEIGEAEQEVASEAATAAYDYLVSKGVPEADAEALLNDWDNDLGASVQEMVAARLPDGEAAEDDIEAFAFGDGADEAVTLDAVYKKRIAFRAGKKTIIRKRVAGTVRLSAKQKTAVRKMLRKSHSAGAQMRRAKSVRARKRAGK